MNTNNNALDVKKSYTHLISSIGNILEEGRRKAVQSINQILVRTYWEIGKEINIYEKKSGLHAEYGSKVFETIAKDLRQRYGKGFSRANVISMRLFYKKYPISQTLSDQLSWSHYVEILPLEDNLERSFYERQSIVENWSVRELKRQMNTALFHRIALSRDKRGVLELAQKGQFIETTKDIIRDPYILEFLNIPEGSQYSEKELEQKIMDHLQSFLLELGKGFTFVERQQRITVNNTHFYVDLVFYHRILKCFVLIDLKIGKVTHQDIGQMNMYLNYFKKEESSDTDGAPIGIILSAEKDEILIEYALGGISNKLFVSKYKLYLPDKQELQRKLQELLEDKRQ